MNLLNPDEALTIQKRVASIWDINNRYWYPLFDCGRNDVIAFDSEYILGEEKLRFLNHCLRLHGVINVFELQEYGTIEDIHNFLDYESWYEEPYFEISESYWFDNNYDWIIYASHEGTITFGGEWLINQLKDKWTDWDSNITWDKKNIKTK